MDTTHAVSEGADTGSVSTLIVPNRSQLKKRLETLWLRKEACAFWGKKYLETHSGMGMLQ